MTHSIYRPQDTFHKYLALLPATFGRRIQAQAEKLSMRNPGQDRVYAARRATTDACMYELSRSRSFKR
jgi:hypothetical protein